MPIDVATAEPSVCVILPKLALLISATGFAKIRVVEGIEEIRAQFQVRLLPQRHRFGDGDIEILKPGAVILVASGASGPSRERRRKPRGIESGVGIALVLGKRTSLYDVRAIAAVGRDAGGGLIEPA